jgi:3-hydroxybutyryl-CoA dehydrogenase
MAEPAIERVGVVGCGQMGSGIAEVCARAGTQVVVVEADREALAGGRRRIESSLQKAEQRGKLEAAASEIVARMVFTTDFAALVDRQLVIEAVVEAVDVKRSVFAQLDRVVEDREAILATNTSSIPVIRLAQATHRPDRVLGLHFFNPVPVMGLVELVATLLTSQETVRRAAEFAEGALGKRVVYSKDRAGFIVNALLIPYLLAAIRMVEAGFASCEDIDASMVEGCRHPMGPLALSDFIGLDTVAAAADSLYQEFKEPLFAPPPLLVRMCDAGLLGRKTGRGFYRYDG